MASQIGINLSAEMWQRFQQTKDFVSNSAQQASQSVKETTNQATERAINTVTTTWEQAKGSVAQSLQTAEQIKSTTSQAVQTAIASSMNDWIAQHPIFFQLVQILGWAANHPIISCIILVFILALLWSLIKAIGRLIEVTSWTILRVPIKLLQALIKVSFLSLSKFATFTVQKMTGAQTIDTTALPINSQIEYQDKQQRLAEISHRLEAIHKEQQNLLQEAASLMASDTNDLKMLNGKLNSNQNKTVGNRQ
ncbi:hypothetical protein NIES2100_16700 [Calothrix sp. NIES-2100]|uniref:hypothetical protein n=1 Tax=Calothrix sp. NIES-2100 TaxID=1954172 RepID=UPI000B602B55|nr:hypothetical protein NIES2100_16700 [Calothrix sp. NIES-2100]